MIPAETTKSKPIKRTIRIKVNTDLQSAKCRFPPFQQHSKTTITTNEQQQRQSYTTHFQLEFSWTIVMMMSMNRFTAVVMLLAHLPAVSLGLALFTPPKFKIVPPCDVAMIQHEEEHDYMPPELLPPLENRPAISTQRLSRMDMQRAIADVKRFMTCRLEQDLNLIPVSFYLCMFFFWSLSIFIFWSAHCTPHIDD
jgi:hypothetical protein